MKTEIEHERCEYTTSLDTSRYLLYLFSSHHVYRMGDCLTGDEWKKMWRRGRRRSSGRVGGSHGQGGSSGPQARQEQSAASTLHASTHSDSCRAPPPAPPPSPHSLPRGPASVAEGEQAQETPPCLCRRSVRGGQARPRRTAVALPLRFSPGVQ